MLVSGSAVANESMLTGESIPVTKVNADNDNHENCDNIQGNKNYNGGDIANESMHTVVNPGDLGGPPMEKMTMIMIVTKPRCRFRTKR